MKIKFGHVSHAQGLTAWFQILEHSDELKNGFHKKFAWRPVKLSSGKWVFCEYYWVRYDVILWPRDGGGIELKRGSVKEMLDSAERLIKELSGE